MLDHPHIVRVLDLCEDEENYYIALELIKNGNLHEVLQKMKEKEVKFTEREIADIIYQILLAVNYIHNSKLMHRDLKLENIMVDVKKGTDEHSSELLCKLTDFGFACMMDPNRRNSLSVGSPLYMAPEVYAKAYDS